MPAFYEAPFDRFLSDPHDLIVGRLAGITRQGMSELSTTQLEAWRLQIPILQNALAAPFSFQGTVLLEYAIPRRGKRIDAILLIEGMILVIEFKCGAKRFDRSGVVQVEDYCLDLRDFHKESKGRTLVPVLVATLAEATADPSTELDSFVAPVWRADASALGETIERAVNRYGYIGQGPLDPTRWNLSEYLPTPTIIESAQALYAGQSVREISRCHAGAENLTRTTDAVLQAIATARRESRKTICFITGVPGAGKTLAGLNIVHGHDRHGGDLGVFLSGNGPLVRVLSEALARDHSSRTRAPVAESRRRVSTFVQNVHRFIDGHYGNDHLPPDKVVLFDEAQRAWNAAQSERKFKRNCSEPEVTWIAMGIGQ